MTVPHLFVAGFGRCGTTLLMTMLDAGGFPVTGPRPSYELPTRWTVAGPDRTWLGAQAGRAVKWIIPSPDFLSTLDQPVRPVVLLMVRDPRQQARSVVKLAGGQVKPSPKAAERAIERSLRRDLSVLRARLLARAEVREFFFESVLQDPGAMALALDDLLRDRFGFTGFDLSAAQRVVMKRHPDCLPDLRMEQWILPMVAQWIEGRRAA